MLRELQINRLYIRICWIKD